MFKNISIKKNISLFLFLFVNFIYGIKYLSRVTDYYFLISITIIVFYLFIWKMRNPISKYYKYLGKFNLLLLLLFFVVFYFGFQKIPVETLKVDRWSVISSFWDNYFGNKYVYFAKSNMNNPPGPMPFYFILALPFYIIGELGYFSILGIVLFFGLLNYKKINTSLQTTALLLVCSSIFYLHEVICRSNIFLNSSIVLFVLLIYFEMKKLNLKKLLVSGILIGLSISTRNVLVIPFIIAFVYELKTKKINFTQISILGFVAISSFAITFLPFVWNHFEDFKQMNPFIIQSTFLVPLQYTLLFIGLAFGFGLLSKSISDIYFFSGLNLSISIFIYYLFHIENIGFYKTFFDSDADITYFVLCTPFFLYYSLLETQENKR